MKIQFTLVVTSFGHAAALEEVLQKHDVSYRTEMLGQSTGKSNGHRRKRRVIGKAEVAAVMQCFANHKGWTIVQVAKNTGVSRATVGRISRGTHALQQK